ncbi:SDR family oxidoreductase [Pelosinus sp. sgz500959]|uniref:SDR family oxidoreductase n=1 Tax=Pelosinus sp. sgz500959 TaxID=3242472 RepID=UPI003672182B
MKYTDKIILVTGGANGIGKVISQEYLKLGATVIVADIDEKNGKVLVNQYIENGHKAIFYQIDLQDSLQIRSMFKKIIETYHKIDILINNAGKGIFKSIYELTIEEWDEVINLNLRAAFIAAQEFAKYCRGNDYGRIVNIASTRYLMSEPNSEAYAASKGGIVSLSHALALSLGSENITVNAISPGWIENNNYDILTKNDHLQHPAKRVGKPEDIFRACLFLTDEKNDFITGQNIVIDGGMTKKMIYVES